MYSFVIFFRRTYKIFIVIAAILVFFIFYNVYIVDRAILNLKEALNQATDIKGFEKVRRYLKVPILREIVKVTTSGKNLMYMELADNISSREAGPQQLNEMKFYLQAILAAKEKERGAILSIADGLNSRFFQPTVELSYDQLLAEATKVTSKIAGEKDKAIRQKYFYDLGNIYLQLGDIKKAKDAFTGAIDIDPKNQLGVKSKFNLAWAYKANEEYDTSNGYFNEVIKDQPSNDIAILSEYQLSDILYKQGKYQAAQEKYAELVKKYPDYTATDLALFQAGYISYHNLNEKEKAVEFFTKLEESFPKAEISSHTRTETKVNMAQGLRLKGFRLLQEKLYSEALDNFNKAIAVASEDSRSYCGAGLSLYWMDKDSEALEKMHKAYKIAPGDDVILVNLIFILINTGNIDEAIQVGEMALAKNPDIVKPEFYYNLGYANLLKVNVVRARNHFEKSIKLNPDFVYAYNNAGCALWADARYADAIRMFKEGISLDPEYAEARFNLGIVYFYINQPEQAYEQFKKVMIINPEYSQIKDYLQRTTEILEYTP